MFTVVCGVPGSGKTTFATGHKGPDALLIDLDKIAESLNPKWRQYKKRSKAIGETLKRIRDVLASSGAAEIWLICCSETTARRYATQYNGTIIRCQYPQAPKQIR